MRPAIILHSIIRRVLEGVATRKRLLLPFIKVCLFVPLPFPSFFLPSAVEWKGQSLGNSLRPTRLGLARLGSAESCESRVAATFLSCCPRREFHHRFFAATEKVGACTAGGIGISWISCQTEDVITKAIIECTSFLAAALNWKVLECTLFKMDSFSARRLLRFLRPFQRRRGGSRFYPRRIRRFMHTWHSLPLALRRQSITWLGRGSDDDAAAWDPRGVCRLPDDDGAIFFPC